MTPKAMRERLAVVAKAMNDMVAALNADNEARAAKQEQPRDWTEEEAKQWQSLTAEAERLQVDIARGEAVEKVQGYLQQPAGNPEMRRANTFPANPATAPQSADQRQEMTALALQAWFRAHTSESLPLSEEHRQACEAIGFNPNCGEMRIQLLRTDQFSDMQSSMATGAPTDAARRARAAFKGINYNAALSSGLASAGGTIMAPETMVSEIEINMLAYMGVAQAAQVMRTPGRERIRWPTANDTGNKGRRLGESLPVASLQPTFGAVYWDAYKYTSDEILVPYELLSGTPFNLPAIIGAMLGERIGRKGNDDLTTGTGSNQPKGLVTAATSFSAGSATAIAWDDLEGLITAVDPAYRMGAAFMFHDAIRAILKNMKDAIGRPLWQEGPNSTEPATLKGYPWFINQSMDSTVASTKKSILFGQFSKYKVRQVDAIRIYRLVERYRENDQDAFLAFLEMDGNLLDAGTAPVKYLLH